MATETLTAEQALDEVLARIFGSAARSWRYTLTTADDLGWGDDQPISSSSPTTYGDLRRWAAPLLAKEEQ